MTVPSSRLCALLFILPLGVVDSRVFAPPPLPVRRWLGVGPATSASPLSVSLRLSKEHADRAPTSTDDLAAAAAAETTAGHGEDEEAATTTASAATDPPWWRAPSFRRVLRLAGKAALTFAPTLVSCAYRAVPAVWRAPAEMLAGRLFALLVRVAQAWLGLDESAVSTALRWAQKGAGLLFERGIDAWSPM